MAGAFFRSPMAMTMANADTDLPQLPQNVRNSRVLVLGGTGRVGGSTAIALSKFCPDLQIIIGGRNRWSHGEFYFLVDTFEFELLRFC